MKKTIALVLAMMFALCAFVTAFAENETETTTTTTSTTESTTTDDKQDGFDTTTTTEAKETTTTTTASSTTTTANADTSTTTAAGTTATTINDETVTVSGTAYEGQGEEGKTTTKKPAAVDTTIPSTGSGIVVPAVALLALAAGTVAVIKTKKED